MEKKRIAVIGATGSQGKGVVNALLNQGTYNIRAITRNPEKYSGNAHEVAKGDLNDVQSLRDVFKNAYGVFVVLTSGKVQTKLLRVKMPLKRQKQRSATFYLVNTSKC